MKILGIIPARYASTRFPGKPLAMIAGKTMIQRVYEQCLKAKHLSYLTVATDDIRIYNAVKNWGGNVLLTQQEHPNGTARCAEAMQLLSVEYDVVINIQGDEPIIHPQQIDILAGLFIENYTIEIATLVKKDNCPIQLKNTNIVKAILNNNDFAIDFKRNVTQNEPWFYKHVGIYGFKRETILALTSLLPTQNELALHLEQLRWLDHQYTIKVGYTTEESISVDVPEDIQKVLELLQKQA